MMVAEDAVSGTFFRRHARRLATARANGALSLGLLLVGATVLLALAGPTFSPYGPDEISAADSLAGPSTAHWFGADNLGRDIFTRVAAAYRISLTVAVGSVLLAVAVAVPLGLIAGYAGGALDNLVMRPLDVLISFPPILLAVMVMAVFGTGITVLVVAIGIIYVPILARLMRGSTLATSRKPFVTAARARGASHRRVLIRHVLPNSIAPVVVQASLLTGLAIMLEAALSFLGLGVSPPTPSLGLMLADGRDFMAHSGWIVAAPGLAIMVSVLAFNLVGGGINRSLDPRGERRSS